MEVAKKLAPLEVEVSARPGRRTFTAEYKGKVLEEIDRCKGPGEIGAILRREGLYSSHLVQWRRARREMGNAELAPKERGPKAKGPDERDRKIAELERENAKLKTRAKKAEALVELQKKVSELLGIDLADSSEEKS